MAEGTGKADWQEVFSDGTDPPAQAGTWEEVGNKKTSCSVFISQATTPGKNNFFAVFVDQFQFCSPYLGFLVR